MLKKLKFFSIIVLLLLTYLPGFAKLQELKQKLVGIEGDIKRLKKENSSFKKRIEELKTDKGSLEILARERLGVVKKGEMVLKIVHEKE